MIEMNVTQAGLAAVTRNQGLTFTRFIAGSGIDAEGQVIQTAEQSIGIAHQVTYIAGQTYTINGVETEVSYNSVKLVGILESALAEANYTWKELALMAREGDSTEEITVAYGSLSQGNYQIEAGSATNFVIPFELIFSDSPKVVVETTATSLTWADFLAHANANISSAGAHGLTYENGDLCVNNQALGLVKQSHVEAVCGLEAIVSVLPIPNAAWLGSLVLNRADSKLYRLKKTAELEVGYFIYQSETNWLIGSGTEAGALLVVADETQPSDGEIILSEAQNHFMAWQEENSFDQRLTTVEAVVASSKDVTIETLDENEYNSEWVSRMTGSGTEASPYLVRTPYDFNQIRENTSAVYRLANNLDFSSAIGIPMSIEGGVLVRGDVNESAPLYNGGAGFTPIATFSGALDGNGKTIKGLTACGSGEHFGMIATLNGGKVQSLTLKEGYIVSSNATNSSTYVGAFVGRTLETAYLINCVNYNTVTTTSTNVSGSVLIGGIVGLANAWDNGQNAIIRNCANHGNLVNANIAPNSTLCGIAGCSRDGSDASKIVIANCYNTANLNGVNIAGITRNAETGYLDCHDYEISNCYNAGVLVGSNECFAIANHNIVDRSETITNCWARSDYGEALGCTAISMDELRSDDFAQTLNGSLTDPIYVKDAINANNGLPMFSFELNKAESIPGNLPLALLDVSKSRLYSSQFSYNQLAQSATKQALKAVKDSVPTLSIVSCSLNQEGWTQSVEAEGSPFEQTIEAATVKADSKLLAVPKSADVFTYGITATSADGQLKFTATTQPTAAISLDVLVIN